MITNINQLDLSQQYTYADYLTWKFTERVELLRGRVFKMSPAPSVRHQLISGNIFLAIGNFLENSPCKIISAPFDVRLPIPKEKQKKGKINTVVQPDICVICDSSKLDEQGCNGAPDLVIEILSPGNSKTEMKDKFEIYQDAGIPEYWLIDPVSNFLIIYSLDQSEKYIGSMLYTNGAIVESPVLEGLKLDLSKVFNNS